MLLKREWTTDSIFERKKRLGICDLFHSQVGRQSTWSLSWENDHVRVTELLERVGAQAAREGFAELGVASDAISTNQSVEFQQVSSMRATMKMELAKRGYELEPGPRKRGSVPYYVRTIAGSRIG